MNLMFNSFPISLKNIYIIVLYIFFGPPETKCTAGSEAQNKFSDFQIRHHQVWNLLITCIERTKIFHPINST